MRSGYIEAKNNVIMVCRDGDYIIYEGQDSNRHNETYFYWKYKNGHESNWYYMNWNLMMQSLENHKKKIHEKCDAHEDYNNGNVI